MLANSNYDCADLEKSRHGSLAAALFQLSRWWLLARVQDVYRKADARALEEQG